MTDFTVPAAPLAREYLREIAADMSDRFDLGMDEAVRRINTFWENLEFIDDDDIIFHEMPEFWSKTIFYGPDVLWWNFDPEAPIVPEGD